MSLRDYVAGFKLAPDVDRYRALLGDEIAKHVQAFRSAQGGGQLTPSRITEWVQETSPEEVLSALEVDCDSADAGRFRELCSMYTEVVPVSLQPQVAWLQRCRECMDPKARPDAGATIAVQKTRDLLSSPSRDVHLLAEVSPE